MAFKRVLVYDSKAYDKRFFEEANREKKWDFHFFEGRLSEDTAQIARGYDAVCLFVNDIATAKIIEQFYDYGVKLIALRSAGYNNVDFRAAYQKIHVARVPAYSPHAVAEHTVALMLTLNRKIHKAYYRILDNNFSINGLLGFDMNGRTVGVIGTGQIGKVVAQILKGFGMNVLAHDAYRDEAGAARIGFRYVDLDTLYRESDIITLHCPLTKDTQFLINAESIAKMKDGVMIVNTSRGQLIQTKALIDGLKRRKIGSAALDVYEEEGEYFFEDFSSQIVADDTLARLLTFNNVLVTSHQAFFTMEALSKIAQTTLENLDDFFSGRKLTNEICYHCIAAPQDCERAKTGKCF